jgi:26S proteasome regulatory subunit T1
MSPYSDTIKKIEDENKNLVDQINKICGIKELDTGLALPSLWDLNADK